MSKIRYLVACICCCIIGGCNNSNRSEVCRLDLNEKRISSPEILFSVANNTTYLYDLNVAGSYVVIWDNKSDTVMRAISFDGDSNNNIFVCKGFDKNGLWVPYMVKNSRKNTDSNTFFVIDNNMYLKQLSINDGRVDVCNRKTFYDLRYSSNFNITEKELFAVSCNNEVLSPFYFYNKEDGYYWVDPDVSILKNNLSPGAACLSNLCVNEDKNRVVSAYRFVNCISFYNLDGDLIKNYVIGDTGLISPIMEKGNRDINVELSSKFFIHIYGTSQYVYCLYSDSKDFSGFSKVLVFNWDCKHIKTYSMDRSLNAIAISDDNKYIFALSYSDEKEQILLKYRL